MSDLFIEPGSPWENGYTESFDGKLRNWLLNGETFYRFKEAQVLIERWRQHDNTIRPHNSLGLPTSRTRGAVAGRSRADLRDAGTAAGSGLPRLRRTNLSFGIVRGGRPANPALCVREVGESDFMYPPV